VVHIPLQGSYPNWRKNDWDSVLSKASSIGGAKHLVIGDFNTTRHRVDEVGTSVPGDQYIRDFEALGWTEAWRKLNYRPESPQYTWQHHPGSQFRLDQAWVSPALLPHLKDAQYDHKVRMQSTSDHSMMIVDFDANALA
jgi:exonuclease III